MSDVLNLEALQALILPRQGAGLSGSSLELRDSIANAHQHPNQFPDADRVSPWLYKSSSNFS